MSKYRIKEHPQGVFKIQYYFFLGGWITYPNLYGGDRLFFTLESAMKKMEELKEYEEERKQAPKYYK